MPRTTNLILLGAGKVGRELIRLVQASGLPIQFIAIADSQAFVTGNPLTTALIKGVFETKENDKSLVNFTDAFPLQYLPGFFQTDTIVVDTSASRTLDLLPALRAGCNLVFANKNALSAPWYDAVEFYNHPLVRYEATVGAGLPVIQTLNSMLATGDQITCIEGVMSGTLGFLCSQLEAGLTYSQAIQSAFSAGFTEPDPRDDLSGFDVARKALILARTAGWPLDWKDLTIEPMLDPSLLALSVEEFFSEMSILDAPYQKMVEKAAAEGKVLRYVGTITAQSPCPKKRAGDKWAKIGLQAVEKESALGALKGPGNYFAFHSQRYQPIPLVISGPGAGIAVTAAGVFGDILDLIDHR